MFVGAYAFRLAQGGSAVDAPDILLSFPIVMLALRFGIRGGLAGATAAVALIVVWGIEDNDPAMGVISYLSWGVAAVFLAALVGGFVQHRRKLERALTHYFDGSLDLLATVDLDGRFVRVNKAWEHTLGYTTEMLCSEPFIDLVHPEDRAATLAEHAIVSGGRRDATGFRNRYRTSEGGYRWLEWTAHVSLDDQLINAVARDVTSLVEAERQVADHAAILEREVSHRTRELEDARAKTLKRLALAAEYRDDDTFEHTERVGETCALIATELGLEAKEIELLRLAAPLHDVGKIAIPDSILRKPGKLTDEELEVMKTHTALGAKLLTGSGSPILQMGTLIAESHHERWDGTGYPRGVVGEDIPLVGRVVSVADVFDALTHDRPYKSAWPVADAIAEIERGAGSQFDPSVVRAFLSSRQHAEPACASARHEAPQPDGASRPSLTGAPARRSAPRALH
ncbi:MAG: HD-GYP domain-containing protein [Solirubrobacterales bacterium]